VLERGVERGDLRADLDVELALDTLGGALFYRVSPDRRGTVVELDARVELPGLLAPLAARAVRRGVDANLAALKRILENAR
jgi:carbon monoxide dehydrogenase subunit G